ncbi:hypothetical protein CC79DRAFT_1331731 [Sarocladium strictum]
MDSTTSPCPAQPPRPLPSPSNSQHSPVTPTPLLSCHGRVRTGCLVCRARKVKCDEQRPACRKCTRLNKTCVYRLPNTWTQPLDQEGDGHSTSPSSQLNSAQVDTSPVITRDDGTSHELVGIPALHLPAITASGQPSPDEGANSFGQPHLYFTESPPNRYQQASQLIYLSIVTDWMAACETPTASSFSYFIDTVDCPLISPFDGLNWTRVKNHIVHLGFEQPPVAQALLAIQVLYRAQVDRLPMAHALSVYKTGLSSFQSVLEDEAADFDVVLIIAFLLCLCAVTLPNEDEASLVIFKGVFGQKLETWLTSGPSRSPVSLRLCAWLQMLTTSSKRQGSPGILPQPVANLLYKHVKEAPSLSNLDADQHPERCLYDANADPIFHFYLRLQAMSHRVADVTHYHRSRTTAEDQVEVTLLMDALKTDLAHLWEERPVPLRLRADKIREHFSAQISEPLIALSGLCIAAFHTETIIIGRILGDRPFPSPEANESLNNIRAVIDSNWDFSEAGGPNAGYLRPLFAYALEVCDKSQSEWAAGRLRQITQPTSRGNFLASFVEAHGEAQRAQGRRVTMKFFCYQTFGIPLPFM